MKWQLAALFLLAAAAPAHAELSGVEAKMVATVDAESPRTLDLLGRMVNVNSGTMNLPGVAAVGRIVRAELEPLGFVVRWAPMAKAGRAGHLIAEKAGRPRTRRLLLIGHLDTVFEQDSPFQGYVRKGDLAEGPGVGDDKGGIAVMIAALRAMQAAGTLVDADIAIVLSGDEEDVGLPISISRADLIAIGKRVEAALDFEALYQEDGRDMGSIARRGSSSWKLVTTGLAGHSSAIFSPAAGDGAIFEMARILAAFRAELPEPGLTFNVGLLAGGAAADIDPQGVRAAAVGKTNIIPAVAEARGDLRALSDEQAQRARDRMKAIVARRSPGTSAGITFKEGGYPAMAATEGNRALLAKLNMVNADLGLPEMPALDPARRGAGDIAFVAKDVAGLAGFGPAGQGSHAPGETVDLASIDRQAKRAALLIYRLSRERR